ncbi:Retrovirus-related Pol polyprotein from transposon RE2 [Linum perenne]
MVIQKLDGRNYLQWSQSMQMHIAGRGKIGYITGNTTKPSESDSTYQTWFEHDNLVRCWLITSMNTNIGENYLLHQSAKDVWDDVKATYSTVDNSAALHEVETRLYNFKQGDLSTVDYYNQLCRLWLQLDMYEIQPWETSKDSDLFKKFVEKKRTMQFLLGLNQTLDDARSRIMSTKPFPPLKEAFAEIRREEYRRQLMITDSKTPEESLAMKAQEVKATALVAQNGKSTSTEEIPFCDHCKKQWHTKEKCWKLVGKPADWKPRSERRGKAAYSASATPTTAANSEPAKFSKDQLDLLQQMFKQFSSSGSSKGSSNISGLLATQGNPRTAYASNHMENQYWILDSGANAHMTSNASLLVNLKPQQQSRVRIADGSYAAVQGIGEAIISQNLVLKQVLYVPNLSCNLLSISQLTKDKNCSTNFRANVCEIQDMESRVMIGKTEMCDGLYLLKGQAVDKLHSTEGGQHSSTTHISTLEDEVMLWHRRLGHPNFHYLEKVYPHLFLNKNPSSYQCDICQFAKHTRAIYSGLTYQPTKPFSIVHSDIWGPTNPTLSGARWFITFIDDHSRTTWTYLMKQKSEAAAIFQTFYTTVLTQFDTKIQVLRSDNAKEYFNHNLGSFLKQHGIIHTSSCVETPQQNGISERKNRHLLEVA